MNLQLNDPSMPAPGEMVLESGGNPLHPTMSPQPLSSSPLLTGRDPHHNRAPSLGELHQELEAEQEAQVVCPDPPRAPVDRCVSRWLANRIRTDSCR